MIIDILVICFYLILLVFIVLLTIFAYKAIGRMKKNNILLEEFSALLEQEMDINESNFGIMNEEIQEFNHELCDKIDELRLQVGIISGRMSQTIHIPPQLQAQDSLPYRGAKRGPKPKKEISND